jgi:hypothetical protein
VEVRYQVFVSSTFLDLREERQEVMQALLELDCIPAGMELFPAANEDQWTLIKKIIDDCDYYIVIVGDRYGSVHKKTGMSYTEMEYRYALENGKPVLAFLIEDPDKLLPTRREEGVEGRVRLEDFRGLLRQKVCKFWDSPADLASQVSRSLIRLIRDHPALGWVRASHNSPSDLQIELKSALNAGIIPYATEEFFREKWLEFRNCEVLDLIGSLPVDLHAEAQDLLEAGKTLRIYRPLDLSSTTETLQLLELAGKHGRTAKFQVFHIDAPFWGTAAIGYTGSDEDPQILVHYGTSSHRTFAGLYLHGTAARRLEEAVRARLASPSSGPIQIDSRAKAEYVTKQKLLYDEDLRLLSRGVPKFGVKQICNSMIETLRNTHGFLHVTHVAQGDTISLLDSDFSDWLDENYRAVQRGVEIVRVMIVPKEDQKHPALIGAMTEMKGHGVQVRLCLIESLQPQFVRDFSIYDEEHLIYIFKSEETGPWLHSDAEARYTVDREAIAKYRVIFEAIRAESTEYTFALVV